MKFASFDKRCILSFNILFHVVAEMAHCLCTIKRSMLYHQDNYYNRINTLCNRFRAAKTVMLHSSVVKRVVGPLNTLIFIAKM